MFGQPNRVGKMLPSYNVGPLEPDSFGPARQRHALGSKFNVVGFGLRFFIAIREREVLFYDGT